MLPHVHKKDMINNVITDAITPENYFSSQF